MGETNPEKEKWNGERQIIKIKIIVQCLEKAYKLDVYQCLLVSAFQIGVCFISVYK